MPVTGCDDNCYSTLSSAPTDIDNDTVCGDVDNCENTPNGPQTNTDNDPFGDACDEDDDNDGCDDLYDDDPLEPHGNYDGDDNADDCDSDDDNDTVLDDDDDEPFNAFVCQDEEAHYDWFGFITCESGYSTPDSYDYSITISDANKEGLIKISSGKKRHALLCVV